MRWRQGRSEHGTLYQVAAKGGLSQCPSASRFDFSVRIEPRADDSLSNRRLILSTTTVLLATHEIFFAKRAAGRIR